MRLEEIFNTYYDRVYSFTLFRVGLIHDAEDITSEVFLRAAKSLHKYNENKASVSTWLFTIAVNEIKRHYGNRREREYLPLETAENVPAHETALDRVLANERTRELYAAVKQLDERQRSIVLLRFYGDMSHKEIARAMKLTEVNVRSILSRSVKKLKILLEKCNEMNFAGYKDIEGKEKEANHVRQ